MVNFVLLDAKASAPDLKTLFHKPLIVGASVSADYNTQSPGKRVALQFTPPENIKVLAQNGKPAKEIISRITPQILQDRTVIVGVDLFFWDSFQADPEPSLKAMEKLFTLARAKNIELVLGEIPELVPFYQKSVVRINQRLRELCTSYDRCKIIPLHTIALKVLSEGHIVRNGKTYELHELLPDGLHISKPASEYLADEILKLFS